MFFPALLHFFLFWSRKRRKRKINYIFCNKNFPSIFDHRCGCFTAFFRFSKQMPLNTHTKLIAFQLKICFIAFFLPFLFLYSFKINFLLSTRPFYRLNFSSFFFFNDHQFPSLPLFIFYFFNFFTIGNRCCCSSCRWLLLLTCRNKQIRPKFHWT